MQTLLTLQGIRSPFLNSVMLFLTQFGDETVLIGVALICFWCVDKRRGFRLMLSCFLAMGVTMLLKSLFVVPRPWILYAGNGLEPVEAALGSAQDASFPSGHSTIAAALYIGLALHTRKKLLSALLFVAVPVVMFTRLYLGVHTPIDVLTGFVIGAMCAAVLYVVQNRTEHSDKATLIMELTVTVLLAVSLIVQLSRIGGVAEDMHDNAWQSILDTGSVLGVAIGLTVCHRLDTKLIHFDTKAVWWMQVLKLVLGAAIALAIKAALKAVLPTSPWSNTFRYGMMLLFAGSLWPWLFMKYAKVAKKN